MHVYLDDTPIGLLYPFPIFWPKPLVTSLSLTSLGDFSDDLSFVYKISFSGSSVSTVIS